MRLPREIPHHPLSADVRHNLFLSFEEALHNLLKHSGAAVARVEMTASPGRFEITITDNGRGFDSRKAVREAGARGVGGLRPLTPGRRGGNGLANMRERLAEAGGSCMIESTPGSGATVRLRIPLGTSGKGRL
jgi:signal transduction histidine kinase